VVEVKLVYGPIFKLLKIQQNFRKIFLFKNIPNFLKEILKISEIFEFKKSLEKD